MLAETAYGEFAEVPPHAHETPLLCLVLEGAMLERTACSHAVHG